MDKFKLMLADNSVIYQKIATFLSYTIGSGLLFGDVMNYLNQNAGAFGVLIGIVTCAVNWWYKPPRTK